LEEEVCATEYRDSEDLINGIEVAVAGTGNLPRQLVTLVGSIRLLCEACVHVEDGHFEQLLFSALTSPGRTNRKYSKTGPVM
jgi:hypothetical protein